MSTKRKSVQPTTKSLTQIPGSAILPEGATDKEAAKLILWGDIGKKTQISPVVADRMKLALSMKSNAIKLIDAMRCTAQPNRHFRRDRLIPSDVNAVSQRIELAKEVNVAGVVCFDNLDPLQEYAQEVAQVEKKIEREHEIFLRQVMVYSVKPLVSFVYISYPLLEKAYSDFGKLRDKYDSVRRKKNVSKIVAARGELVDQARVMASLMDEIPSHQLTFAKALDLFVRAEGGFGGKLSKMTVAVKQPDSKSRWATQRALIQME